jgi:hypothetical protein
LVQLVEVMLNQAVRPGTFSAKEIVMTVAMAEGHRSGLGVAGADSAWQSQIKGMPWGQAKG